VAGRSDGGAGLKLSDLREFALRTAREEWGEPPCLWPAPYDELSDDSAWRFLTECWWTLDSASQQVALIPDKPYLKRFVRQWLAAFVRRSPLVVEKSRRMVISWLCRGLETWVMGLSRGSVLLIDQKHENSAEHLWRVHFALSELKRRRPELEIPTWETYGSASRREVASITLGNGSLLRQSHQEAGSEQGKGYTLVVMEEISRYMGASQFWSQAALVTQGKPGSGVGGWICAIANPVNNPSWEQVKQKMDPRKLLRFDKGWNEPANEDDLPGLAFHELPGGTVYCALHYSADPEKTSAWASDYRRQFNMSLTDWNREMELYGGAVEGKPVYPDFIDGFHSWPDRETIPLVKGATYFGGWDAGQTVNPAFVLIQLTPLPWQVHVLLEVCGSAEPMVKFAPRVQQALIKALPARWQEVRHFGDMTISTRNGSTGTTARQAAAEYGFNIVPVPNTIFPRIDAVTRLLLRELDDGRPCLLVDTVRAPAVYEGFKGAYRFAPRLRQSLAEPGAELKNEPEKNAWSHPHDALQYPALKIVEMIWGPSLEPSGRMGRGARVSVSRPGWKLG